MDYHSNRTMFIRRPISNKKIPPVRWVREWVPQENAATGKTIYLLKWVRADMLKAIKDKFKEPEPVEAKPEPTTEILYLCTFEGCNKVFPTEGTYRKHAHIHGERQHACTYPGCGKKFLDSSKLKRHQVVHTGEKNYICTYEGCGKAFNLDFNLRAHMKIHSQEHYHICQYPDCGKRYTQECKLRSHIKSAHEKNTPDHTTKTTSHSPQTPQMAHIPAVEKIAKPPTPISVVSHPSDRPYVCPYEGCGKDYIHEYKLNLHLKSQHPGHFPEENEQLDHNNNNAYIAKSSGAGKNNVSRIKPNITSKMPPAKMVQPKGANVGGGGGKQESMRQEIYRVGMHGDDSDDDDDDDSDDDDDDSGDGSDDDSEETEEERDGVVRNDWRFRNDDGGDDEETEDEN